MFLIESTHLHTAPVELIAEKIAVPSRLPLVSRPRLVDLLENSLRSCTSTILSGRAGTGKTALAVDFALNSQRKIAWYKVDAPEAELPNFFQYLIASIRKHRPAFGADFMALVSTEGPTRHFTFGGGFCLRTSRGEGGPFAHRDRGFAFGLRC